MLSNGAFSNFQVGQIVLLPFLSNGGSVTIEILTSALLKIKYFSSDFQFIILKVPLHLPRFPQVTLKSNLNSGSPCMHEIDLFIQ